MNTPPVCPPRWGGGSVTGARNPEGGRSRPPCESPSAGRSRTRGGSRGRGKKKIGLQSFGPIFLCRGARSGLPPNFGCEGGIEAAEESMREGMGEVPPREGPLRPTSGAGREAGRVRGAKAPGSTGGPTAKPQHTPGRGYGGRAGHEGRPDEGGRPLARGEGRVLPVGAGAYPARESGGGGPVEGPVEASPAARRAAVPRMPAP